MTIRAYQTWAWDDWLIWGGGFLFTFAGTIALQFSPSYSSWAKVPAFAAPAAWLVAALALYRSRRAFADSIAWTTTQGVWVVPGAAGAWPGISASTLEVAIREVADFWWKWDRARASIGRWPVIENYLNGTALIVRVQAWPLEDPRHGIKAKGLTYPRRVVVRMDPAALIEMGGLTAENARAEFWAVVRHEFGHVCLDALGVPQADQHAVMRDAGWADA